MPGDIFAKGRAIATVSSTIASMINNSAAAAGSVSFAAAGSQDLDLTARFEWTVKWPTVTGIANGVVVGELYAVPKMDGTTQSQQIDLTAGASAIPGTCRVGSFVAVKAPTANTDTVFYCPAVAFDPDDYDLYIKNTSGQTTTVNSVLKVKSARGQYS